jgi:Tetratricopeptide repeat
MNTKTAIRTSVVLFFIAWSFSSLAQSVRTQVYDAQTAIANKDWTAAEAILTAANQGSPNNPHVLYEMAQVYENTNRLDDATKIYQNFSKIPEAKLREYIVLVRSANGMQLTNLAALTQSSLDRITAKQAMGKPVAPPVVSAPVVVAPKLAPTEPITSSTEVAVTLALQKWAMAWANKDLTSYFASYAKNFQGNRASTAAWMKSRQTNITSKKQIALDLSDIQITALSSTKAQINFKQNYSSNTIKEVSNKSLLMTKVDQAWLIEQEAVR